MHPLLKTSPLIQSFCSFAIGIASLPQIVTSAQDINLLFEASYTESPNADYSMGLPGAGGFGWELVENGASGSAISIKQQGGHVHYRSDHNISTECGTLSFQTKGPAIAGQEGMAWLLGIRGHAYDMGVVVEDNALHFRCVRFENWSQPVLTQLSLPLEGIDQKSWHTIRISWDVKSQSGLLELDGKQVEGRFELPYDFGPSLAFYLGGGADARLYPGGMLQAGNAFDELKIWSRNYKQLDRSQKPSPELYQPIMAGSVQRLKTLATLQHAGGWQVAYTWPTMIGCYAQGRGHSEYPDIISLDKSNGSAATAARFLYAYDVLGDQSFLEVARKTGDLLVHAQSDEGYWLSNYSIESGKIESPLHRGGASNEPKFQDGVQSQAIALLLALYKITGESDYIRSAQKAGEFYLKAQNPDGSWSYKYDPKKGIGVTFLSKPQGGEINDYAMNDAIGIMVLLYHYTEDMRYIEAAKRAGDWLVQAKISGAVHGWAQQYDNHTHPASARHHEPAALSSEDTLIAANALIEVYRLSKDPAYLKPIIESAQWLEERFPEGVMYKYYDPATGRPVASWENQLYYIDDPEQMAAAQKFPLNPLILVQQPIPDLKKLLANANTTDPDSADYFLTPQITSLAKNAVSSQNELGLWIMDNIGGGRHTIGTGFNPARTRMVHLLNYLEASLNEMGLDRTRLEHHGDIMKMAAPLDWYNVPWPHDAKKKP